MNEKSKWTVTIDKIKGEGFFEYDGIEGGGLWFEDDELVDFDGLYFLPRPVAEKIIEMGYKVDVENCCL